MWQIFVFVFANTSPNICICPFLSTQIYLYWYSPFLIKPKNTWIHICPILSTQIYSYSYLFKKKLKKRHNFFFFLIIFNEAPGIVYYSIYVHNSHTSIAFISINIFFLLGSDHICICVHICKLFANISPNNFICIHICPLLVNPNIFDSLICRKNLNVNQNIFVFVFDKNC